MKEYVPLGSENEIVFVVDENDWPLLKFTYHVVPEGNPDSVKVAVYLTMENVTDLETEAPFTVIEPVDEEGS